MPDGASVRDHEDSASRQWAALGKKPAKAAGPGIDDEPCPEGAGHVWRWFCEIVAGLDGNGFAPPVVSWAQLAAWARLRHIDIEPWEALALVRLGALRAAVLSEKTKPTSTPGGRPNG